jgi:hypothetical protein
MSVRPDPAVSKAPSLSGSEGELVSVSISVEPRLLESLLDALAEVHFPVNPQIYHEATVAFAYPDGREIAQPTTIIEFPAYLGQLQGVRELLAKRGFDPASIWATNLLDDIHSNFEVEPAPPGAPYTAVIRRRHPARPS